MQVLVKAIELSLAALLSFLSQAEQGFKHMEAGEYAKAAEVLTHVIGSEYATLPVEEPARLARAEAYIKLKIPREAQPDLAYLIQHSRSEEVRKQAQALFIQVDGNLADFLPRESAETTARNAIKAARTKAFDALPHFFSGELANAFEVHQMIHRAQTGGADLLSTLLESSEQLRLVDVRTNAQQQAEVVVQNGWIATLEMTPVAGAWKFTRLKGYTLDVAEYHKLAMARFAPERLANLEVLKQYGAALQLFVEEHGTYPNEVEALVPFLPAKLAILTWTHPAGRAQQAFWFREQATEALPQTAVVMAAPEATGGKREVLYADGRIDVLTADEFVQRTRKEGWVIPTLVDDQSVSKEQAREVAALINDLQQGDFRARREAKKRLKALGSVAYPLLLEHQHSPDPELRETVAELLKPRK